MSGLGVLREVLLGTPLRLLPARWHPWGPAASVLALLLLAVRPVTLGAHELARFYDPVYARPFLPEVARWALARTTPAQRVLVTPDFGYTMYPADPLFFRYDETYYFHHVSHLTLWYLVDRRLDETPPVPFVRVVAADPLPGVPARRRRPRLPDGAAPLLDPHLCRAPDPETARRAHGRDRRVRDHGRGADPPRAGAPRRRLGGGGRHARGRLATL